MSFRRVIRCVHAIAHLIDKPVKCYIVYINIPNRKVEMLALVKMISAVVFNELATLLLDWRFETCTCKVC